MCFYFCSFLLQPVFVSRFYNPYLVLRFRPPSHLSCASFCIPSFRSSSLAAFYLLSKHISRDPINGMRTLFRTRCLVSASFISSFLSISSSWYAALDTNGEETISQVLTSFRNQLSRFLSHQYHLGGMRLWSLILDIRYSENYSSGSTHPHPTYSDPDHKYTHFSYANICFRTYDHTSFLAPVFCIRYVSLIGTLFFWIRYLGAGYRRII